jgi:hypothetical protein
LNADLAVATTHKVELEALIADLEARASADNAYGLRAEQEDLRVQNEKTARELESLLSSVIYKTV